MGCSKVSTAAEHRSAAGATGVKKQTKLARLACYSPHARTPSMPHEDYSQERFTLFFDAGDGGGSTSAGRCRPRTAITEWRQVAEVKQQTQNLRIHSLPFEKTIVCRSSSLRGVVVETWCFMADSRQKALIGNSNGGGPTLRGSPILANAIFEP